MGCRLHVAKTYKVEYGKADFNRLQEQINLLLDDLCEHAEWNDNIADYSNEVELNKEELKRGINYLRNEMDDEEFFGTANAYINIYQKGEDLPIETIQLKDIRRYETE